MVLNLVEERGQEVFKRLVAVSDVVIDNFTPRVMPNFGLDYEHLRTVNPSIISVGISGFGSWGPWRNWAASAPSTDTVSGLSWLMGYEGGGPIRPANFNPDFNAGLFGVLATLVALEKRRRTGEAQRVDATLFDGTLQFLGEVLIAISAGVAVDGRKGNREPEGSPAGVYPDRPPVATVENRTVQTPYGRIVTDHPEQGIRLCIF
mgnify:CR=1 FL=1